MVKVEIARSEYMVNGLLLVEKKLRPTIFHWEKVIEEGGSSRLKQYLINNFNGVEWIKDKKIELKEHGKVLTVTKGLLYSESTTTNMSEAT
jgi:hypothetical protein